MNLNTAIVVAAGMFSCVAAAYLKIDPKAITAIAVAFIGAAGAMEKLLKK